MIKISLIKVSINQIDSAHPGLVPWLSGCHTIDLISAVTCFLDHMGKFGYINLCISTSQDNTLLSNFLMPLLRNY